MGSKNLKAIVVMQGTNAVTVADPQRLEKIVNELLNKVEDYHLRNEMLRGGAMAMTAGWLRKEYWAEIHGASTYPSDTKKVQAEVYELHKQSRKKIACSACPMSDKDRLDLAERGMVTYDSAVFPEGDNNSFSCIWIQFL